MELLWITSFPEAFFSSLVFAEYSPCLSVPVRRAGCEVAGQGPEEDADGGDGDEDGEQEHAQPHRGHREHAAQSGLIWNNRFCTTVLYCNNQFCTPVLYCTLPVSLHCQFISVTFYRHSIILKSYWKV